MFEHTTLIPPHITPPDPWVVRVLSILFSMFLSGVLLLFIGFVGIEFLADMLGYPLHFGTHSPHHDIYPVARQNIPDPLKSHFELITPKHHTQTRGPEVVVIYTHRMAEDCPAVPPNLLIDDNPYPWEIQFGNNTWFTRLQLQEGLHRIQVEKAEAEFVVKITDPPLKLPDEWAWNRPHPDTDKIDRCYDCHEFRVQLSDQSTMQRTTAIGAWKGPESCFECHDQEEHTLRHVALLSTTTQCFRCHSQH